MLSITSAYIRYSRANRGVVHEMRRSMTSPLKASLATNDLEVGVQYHIPVVSSIDEESKYQYLLLKDHGNNIVSLKSIHFPKEKPFYLDYNNKTWRERFKQCSTELVVKALGKDNDIIIDFTTGLGRDSLLLASANPKCRFLLFEQNPVIFLLFQNALERLYLIKPKLKDQVILRHVSAKEMRREEVENLLGLSQGTIANYRISVYLDPMYPITAEERKAQVKKETQILHRVLSVYGQDYSEESIEECMKNDQELFEAARQLANKRIVVKRGMDCPALKIIINGENVSRNYAVKGSNQRFDVYDCSGFKTDRLS